jgi:hypothetical protein
MNESEQNRLLREVLEEEKLQDLREASLARGLAALRVRRRHRRQWQTVLALAPLLLLLGLWHFRPAPPRPPLAVASAPPPAAPAKKINYITKEELFALFPHRPIALIGEAGHEQFLLLDELPRTETQ